MKYDIKKTLLLAVVGVSAGCSIIDQCETYQSNSKAAESDQKSTIQVISGNPLTTAAPDVIYDIWRVKATPSVEFPPSINPPNLQWPKSETSNARYTVELSQDKKFKDAVITSEQVKWCFFNPNKKLNNGQWYWRYTTSAEGSVESVSDVKPFTITEQTPVFEYPHVKTLVANIPKQRPYMLTYGKPINEVIENAKKLPEQSKAVLESADQSLAKPIVHFDTTSTMDRTMREKKKLNHNQLKYLKNLIQAYLISGEAKYRDTAIKRLDNIVSWHVKDEMMLSNLMRTVAIGYDSLYANLTSEQKQKITEKIEPYLEKRYNKWSGRVENRQIENHFWQMEMSAFFDVALATAGEFKNSEKYLGYGYGVFMARSPVVGGNDGGWANGHGYFIVNNSTIVHMAYMLQKVAGVDVFSKPWYRALPDYLIYSSPSGGAIDGFGDMHDRRGTHGMGGPHSLFIGYEKDDPKALWHAAQVTKRNGSINSWFQLVNGFELDPEKIPVPAKMPQAKVFKEVGLVAMHTKLTQPKEDLALYFRSSPYGGNGHMHANQNCFNISYKGKKVFYSTGYYTSFADPHSITSYKHTRASNGILINGKGQPYGHEGYGWIKRYLHGEQISYTCGDASMAYRDLVNEQWTTLTKNQMTKEGKKPEDNFGDAKLKKFDRHVAFLRPSTFVIYDVLESEQDNDWSLLLHTYKESKQVSANQMVTENDDFYAQSDMFSSSSSIMNVTDQFYEKPVDFLKKYKQIPNQYHMTYKSAKKSKKMRFLTIIQCHDSKAEVIDIKSDTNGELQVGEWTIKAELDVNKKPSLYAANKTATLEVNGTSETDASVLTEQIDGKIQSAISLDQAPATTL